MDEKLFNQPQQNTFEEKKISSEKIPETDFEKEWKKSMQEFAENIIETKEFNFVKNIQKQFPNAGVFVVGGSVRDIVIKQKSKDIDLVVNHIKPAELIKILIQYGKIVFDKSPKLNFEKLLQNENGIEKINQIITQSFGVLKFHPNESDLKEPIDIAFPRKDVYDETSEDAGIGIKRNVITIADPEMDIKDDLERRDFTFNAMALNLVNYKVIDPFNGIGDLLDGKIKMVGNPNERMNEDATRAFRAIRFFCRFGKEMDIETKTAIKKAFTPLENPMAENFHHKIYPILRNLEENKKSLEDETIKTKKAYEIAMSLLNPNGNPNEPYPELVEKLALDYKYVAPEKIEKSQLIKNLVNEIWTEWNREISKINKRFELNLTFDDYHSPQGNKMPWFCEIYPDKNGRPKRLVSNESIAKEIFRALSDNPVKCIEFLDEIGGLKYIFPEIEKLKNVAQPPEHHSEGDVFTHTILALKKLPKDASLRLILAALEHDIGKPKTQKILDNGKIVFYGHEKISAEMLEQVSLRFVMPKELYDDTRWLVAHHMFIHNLNWDTIKNSTIEKIFLTNEELGIELIELTKADAQASIPPNGSPKLDNILKLLQKIKELRDAREKIKSEKGKIEFITAEDLKQNGMKMGITFGFIIKFINNDYTNGLIKLNEQEKTESEVANKNKLKTKALEKSKIIYDKIIEFENAVANKHFNEIKQLDNQIQELRNKLPKNEKDKMVEKNLNVYPNKETRKIWQGISTNEKKKKEIEKNIIKNTQKLLYSIGKNESIETGDEFIKELENVIQNV